MLFVGRLHTVKGVDLLLRAWSLVQQQVTGTTLRVVGSGQGLANLRSLCERLGINGSVVFEGDKTKVICRVCTWEQKR